MCIKHFTIFWIAFCILNLFASCSDDSIDYREKIIGKWELKNVGELQPFYTDYSFILKNAEMEFNSNGSVTTFLFSASNEKKLISQTAEWIMPKSGGNIKFISDNGPFQDVLKIDFLDERTFMLGLNGIQYVFVKV